MERKIDAFVVVSKGTIIVTIPRKRIPKILHKLPMFYLLERRKKKMVDACLCAIYGERLEIKVLSSY